MPRFKFLFELPLGSVSYNHGLFAPLNDEFRHLELRFRNFKILCLRPSPAPLKVLCRSVIRLLTNHSNEKITQINQSTGELFIPGDLIKYLRYPSNLRVCDYMLKGEKIVREDQKYELVKHI